MLRTATEPERARILAAVPEPARLPRFAGGVASVLLEQDGAVLDGAVRLGEPAEVWVRTLAPSDAVGLDACLSMLERRRAQVAHDASGPATGVLAAIETVLEYEPVPDSTRSLLEDARVGLGRLTRMLTDRSELLGQPSNVVEGSLATLLRRSALPSIEELVTQGRLHVDVRAPESEVRLDVALIEGVLATLLSNAWTCRRGQAAVVGIEAALESGVLWISVADDGRGLDSDTIAHAGALGFAHRPNGVGVGLFQLRRALQRPRGAFVIQSLPRGARASVLLPLNSDPAAP